jgi:hypothetical protein
VHEANVVRILEAVGPRPDALFQQPYGQVRSPGPTGWLLGQEERAELVGDVEIRIEGRRQIKERVQQLVRLVGCGRQAGRPVMLNRADPVQIGHQIVVREREARQDRRRTHVQNLPGRLLPLRKCALPEHLQRHDTASQDWQRYRAQQHGRKVLHAFLFFRSRLPT